MENIQEQNTEWVRTEHQCAKIRLRKLLAKLLGYNYKSLGGAEGNKERNQSRESLMIWCITDQKNDLLRAKSQANNGEKLNDSSPYTSRLLKVPWTRPTSRKVALRVLKGIRRIRGSPRWRGPSLLLKKGAWLLCGARRKMHSASFK